MHSTAVLRGMKYPKITLYSSAIVGVANVILSYFLGIVLNFGVEGIAIASSIAFFNKLNIFNKSLNQYSNANIKFC